MWCCLHILLMEVCGLEVEGLLASPTVRTNCGVGDYCKVEVQRSRVPHLRQPGVLLLLLIGLYPEFVECWFSALSTSTVCMHSFIQRRISLLPCPRCVVEEASELGTTLPLGS